MDTLQGLVSLGIPLSFAQWIVVFRYIPKPTHWLVATFFGWFIGGLVAYYSYISNALGSRLLNVILFSFVFGALIAIPQWLVLRKYITNFGWWIPANALGWGLMSVAIGELVASTLEQILFGAIPAVVTGLTLFFLMDQSQSGGEQPHQVVG